MLEDVLIVSVVFFFIYKTSHFLIYSNIFKQEKKAFLQKYIILIY